MSVNNNQTEELNQEDQEKNKNNTIQRAPHENKFFVCTRAAMQNKRISLQAKGLLGLLLSFSDGFYIRKDALAQFSQNGREATRNAFKELLEAKYIYMHIYFLKGLKRIKYYLFETPYHETSQQFKEFLRYAENPRVDERTAVNTTLNNTNKDNTNINNTKNKESKPKKETADKSALASDDAHFVSNLLYEKLKEKNPKYKKPDVDKWAKDIDIIIKQDKRTREDLITIINWAFAHKGDYWPIVIQSPRTLRKMFDRAWTEITHLSEKEKTTSVFEKQTKEMNIRWLKDKIATLERIGARGNLGYNNTHAYDTILDFSTPLSSPKMIDMVKGWDKFRRR